MKPLVNFWTALWIIVWVLVTLVSTVAATTTTVTAADFIKGYEGLSLTGYYANDYEEDRNIVTIGWGSTFRNVVVGQEITLERAEAYFRADLLEAEEIVDRLVKVPLTDNQRVAIVSLAFNTGYGNLSKSDALRYLNQSNYERFAYEAFDSEVGFVRSGGEIVKGLVNRRAKERSLFFTTI